MKVRKYAVYASYRRAVDFRVHIIFLFTYFCSLRSVLSFAVVVVVSHYLHRRHSSSHSLRAFIV